MDDIDFEKRIEAISEIRSQRSSRYLAILEESEDLTALILKGHLVVEELLTSGIEAYCQDVDQLKKANLRFAQKLPLLRALERLPVVNPRFWDAIARLNRLRNELAHNLESSRIDEISGTFVKAVEAASSVGTKFPEPKESREALSQALSFIIGGLEVLVFWHEGVEEMMLKRISE
jgi:uncharacterized protein YutE (UPF0331/DUF86 family)